MKAGGGCGGWEIRLGEGWALSQTLKNQEGIWMRWGCGGGGMFPGKSVHMGYNSYLYLNHQGVFELLQLMIMGGKQPENQRRQMACPRSHSKLLMKPGVLTLSVCPV